jgi:toxin YoeB
MKTISFTKAAWADYNYWVNTDQRKLKKINSLIDEVTRTPFVGTGQPEQLKHQLSGFWSRRIDGENRLVYAVRNENIEIISCKGHYR